MSKKLLIAIIIFLVLLLVGGGAGIFWYLTQKKETTEKTKIEKQVNPEHETLSEIGPLYPVEPITVNLKTPDEKDRYLIATLSLELDDKLLSNELDAKIAVIRDKIILILSSKTIEDVSSVRGKKEICDEIKEKLNAMLTDGKIRNIYIVKFIIQ